jgi:hypothetical protein
MNPASRPLLRLAMHLPGHRNHSDDTTPTALNLPRGNGAGRYQGVTMSARAREIR